MICKVEYLQYLCYHNKVRELTISGKQRRAVSLTSRTFKIYTMFLPKQEQGLRGAVSRVPRTTVAV